MRLDFTSVHLYYRNSQYKLTAAVIWIVTLNISGIQAEEINQTIELPTVVITTPFQNHSELDMVQPITVLQGDELRRKRRTSLGDTLSNELGVSSSSFGPASGRPIIRGLDGPRIKVMENGIDALDLSSISPDHAVSIESLNASQIEILRGPATLLYGGGATGGVVNVISGRIPDRLFKSLNGNIEARGDTATEERAGSLNLMGSMGSISWSLGGFKRKTNDYAIPGRANKNETESKRGDVQNSATDSEGGSLGASFISSRGFLGASFSRLESEYGIPSPERSSIDMKQSRFDLSGELDDPMVGFEKLKIRAGYNDYQHDEVEISGEIGTRFKNRAVESRAELLHAPILNWQGVFGVQFQNRKFSALGGEALVPPTHSYSTGFFLVEERNWDTFRLEFGGRVELAKQNPQDNSRSSRSFNLFSGSIGATWKFLEGYALGLSVTRGQRAPTTEELYSEGAHASIATFDIGSNALKKETANNIDFSLSKTAGVVKWKVNLFVNRFDNYIFRGSLDTNGDGIADRVDEAGRLVSDGEFLLQNFAQTDATFYGAEAEINVALIPEKLDLRLFTDYVRSKLDNNGHVPRVTPLRFGFEMNHRMGPWAANVRTTRVMRQKDVARLETETSGYTLLNTEVSYRIKAVRLNGIKVFLQGNNLLNEEIRVHTSFLKNFAPLPGRAIVVGLRSDF